MQNKKLLSITNLKKYFPIPKNSIFQKEQLYVRANEDITFDIYEGETIGVVGESGCGKSTLGRVLLQLYPQTAGTTFYYGRTIDDVAPKYIFKTLNNCEKYIKKYRHLEKTASRLMNECEACGENATFYQHQSANLAEVERKTALKHITSIIGGFFVLNQKEREKGLLLLKKLYDYNIKIAKRRNDISNLETLIFSLNEKLQKNNSNFRKLIESYKNKCEKKLSILNNINNSEIISRDNAQKELDDYREKFSTNIEFMKYQNELDGGIDLARLTYNEMRPIRRDLQIIFQDPYSSLNPRMTISQIIEEGLITHNLFKKGSEALQNYIKETTRKCGLQDYMINRYPHQFSGGQRQRISIARALAVKPKFIVCDECVSALDVSIQSQIINLLQELKEKENLTYLFISHDLSVVRYISNKIIVMYLGNIVESASAEELFKDPRHPYTLALLSSIPTTDIDSLNKERILLEGNIPSPIKPPTGCKFHTRCFMCTEKCKRIPPKLTEISPGHFVACHYLEKKIDEKGKYLFKSPKMVKRTIN